MKTVHKMIMEYVYHIEYVNSIFEGDYENAKACVIIDLNNSIKVIEDMIQITWDVRKIYVDELQELIREVRLLK